MLLKTMSIYMPDTPEFYLPLTQTHNGIHMHKYKGTNHPFTNVKLFSYLYSRTNDASYKEDHNWKDEHEGDLSTTGCKA